jgi:hypothetical protein
MKHLDKYRNLAAFGYICFLVLWLAGSLLLLARIAAANELLVSFHDQTLVFSDFVNCYWSGQLTMSNLRHEIYNATVQLDSFNRLIAPAHVDKVCVIQYPPMFFLFMAPMTVLPINLAFLAWCAVSIGLGIWGLSTILHDTGRYSMRQIALFLLAVCVFLPAWMTIRMGQLAWWVVALAAAFCLAWKRRRDVICGAILAISTVKPQYTPFLALPVLGAQRWKVLIAAAFFEAVLLGACILIYGLDNVVGYPSFLMHAESSSVYAGVHPEKMVSLRGLLSSFLPQSVVLPVSFVALAASLSLLWVWHAASKGDKQLLPWAMGLTVVFALVVNPHVHFYDCLLLSVAAGLTLPTVNLFAAVKLQPVSLRVWTSLLLLYPILSCGLFVYWDVFRQWSESSINPFAFLNLFLLLSGFYYFRSLQKSSVVGKGIDAAV